ncbi:hypothetical protein C8A03DRAFT_36924 [Achaetomium macrosporum]|uniref:Uncharacterized protein n=1 Tax=Achaetomium macrosporum TaxID=79813 RepID=A0AAN7C6C4_9PEZI|nr:hypothetical protein C8A03DRAFT_36924 [Achaetomium macrosporum]
MSHADFDPSTPNGNPNNNPLCGKRLRASYNGKNVDVTVIDHCVPKTYTADGNIAGGRGVIKKRRHLVFLGGPQKHPEPKNRKKKPKRTSDGTSQPRFRTSTSGRQGECHQCALNVLAQVASSNTAFAFPSPSTTTPDAWWPKPRRW